MLSVAKQKKNKKKIKSANISETFMRKIYIKTSGIYYNFQTFLPLSLA